MFIEKKELFKERGLNKKQKENFLTAFTTAIKKDPHNVNKKAR